MCCLLQSRDLLQSLLKLEADNTRALGMLGSLEWKAGNHELAREHLVAAVEANPKHVANLHTLARLELAEGNLQEARELFARGQQLEPHNAYVLQVPHALLCLIMAFARFRILALPVFCTPLLPPAAPLPSLPYDACLCLPSAHSVGMLSARHICLPSAAQMDLSSGLGLCL